MTRTTLIGTAALLSLLGATPVLAQHMIEEPGVFAFYHPNSDVLNSPRNAAPASQSYASTVLRADARMGSPMVVTKRRHRK